MPDAQITGRSLYYERHGDASGEPLLLIQGLSGSHASWGDRVPRRARAGPGPHRVRPSRHRHVGRDRRAVHDRRPRPGRGRAARRAGDRARPRPRDLDGRHDRAGAGARPSRARPHADARVHLPGRAGIAPHRPGDRPADHGERGIRRPAGHPAHELRGQRVARLRGEARRLGGLPGERARGAGADPGALRAAPRDGLARHERAARRADGADPRDPRRRRRDARRQQRRADRAPGPGRAPGDPPGRRAPVLDRGPGGLGGPGPRATSSRAPPRRLSRALRPGGGARRAPRGARPRARRGRRR